MAGLEDIILGSNVKGIVANEIVEIIAVKWYGNDVLDVTYKTPDGHVGNRLIMRDEENELEIANKSHSWSFDADGNTLRLVSEAYRIALAHVFDPYLAVHTSSVEPLPHQISAVYQEMLPRLPLRFILADDPGAGKTIMTGLLLKELLIRGDLKRCLIVSPGSLCENWQDELNRKFHLNFEILTNDRIETSISGNVFNEMHLCIARLDKLARDEELQNKFKVIDWDLIVVDEAHKMSASIWGGEVKTTRRFKLGRLLSECTRHFLLLTATPHNGKEADFQLFLSLVDQDMFEGAQHSGPRTAKITDIMRRLVKEELLKFDGTPLFPERKAYTVNYTLSQMELELYEKVTDYVRSQFNLADTLDKERKHTVGFALTILQRRLASSPEAIYQSLKRRRERLEDRLARGDLGRTPYDRQCRLGIDGETANFSEDDSTDDFDEDDYSSEEIDDYVKNVAVQASAATTVPQLQVEIDTLKQLEKLASDVRASGKDKKWDELSSLLQNNESMFTGDHIREKLIIFTEHRDTLLYLEKRIASLFGKGDLIATIHGGMSRDERRKVERKFKQDKILRILIATDAAGEGINLQCAHLMINYDLPWNPNRLEQRFGRIHRIGQTEVCHLWNLVAKQTREGLVFQRLFEKLEREKDALGGKVFDILGKLTFEDKPLPDLLREAIIYGDRPEVRERLLSVVENATSNQRIQELIAQNALTEDTMDFSKVMEIRAEMERIEAHKLQPHFIEAFFIEAFKSVGGQIARREHGRYEIKRVPSSVRGRDAILNSCDSLLTQYERVCFEKGNINPQGLSSADLLCPGHPLLEATIDLIRERHSDVLKRGAVLIDDDDLGCDARLLFYIEDTIQDGVLLKSGSRRVISKDVHFVELREDGISRNAGYAPYLDYRAATNEELAAVGNFIKSQEWLNKNVEEQACNYAIRNIIPVHLQTIKTHRVQRVERIAKAVKDRLRAEIWYWDGKAGELKEREQSGKRNAKLNSDNASRRADELEARMHKRLEELDKEKMVSALPPVIVGGALVIPVGLLYKLMPKSNVPPFSQGDKKAIENAGMNAVMLIEQRLGYAPTDVHTLNLGYDIESEIPKDRKDGTACLRFIEVKGRVKGADDVIVSKNEILTALNKPEEFILALVEVDGDQTRTTYLKRPFKNAPDFAANGVIFNIAELLRDAEVIYQE